MPINLHFIFKVIRRAGSVFGFFIIRESDGWTVVCGDSLQDGVRG
jgi:hypothetical protein